MANFQTEFNESSESFDSEKINDYVDKYVDPEEYDWCKPFKLATDDSKEYEKKVVEYQNKQKKRIYKRHKKNKQTRTDSEILEKNHKKEFVVKNVEYEADNIDEITNYMNGHQGDIVISGISGNSTIHIPPNTSSVTISNCLFSMRSKNTDNNTNNKKDNK